MEKDRFNLKVEDEVHPYQEEINVLVNRKFQIYIIQEGCDVDLLDMIPYFEEIDQINTKLKMIHKKRDDERRYDMKDIKNFARHYLEKDLGGNWKSHLLKLEDYKFPRAQDLFYIVMSICMNCNDENEWPCLIECLEKLSEEGEIADLDVIFEKHKQPYNFN